MYQFALLSWILPPCITVSLILDWLPRYGESVISSFPPLPEADLSELLGAIKWVGNKLFIQSVFPCVTHLLWRECEADASLLTRQAAAKKQQHCRSLNKFQRSRDFYNYHMSKSASQQHPLFSSSPESQMPQMLLTDVSIWKESGTRELRKGRERHGQIKSSTTDPQLIAYNL